MLTLQGRTCGFNAILATNHNHPQCFVVTVHVLGLSMNVMCIHIGVVCDPKK